MDFALNDDRRMLAETLGRFLQENYAIDRRHADSGEVLRAAALLI
jgi:hypothetical protein